MPLNANYGGVLQAYALQRIVRDLGFRPVTDTSRPKPMLKRLRWRLLRHPYRWVRLSMPARADWDWRSWRLVTAPLRVFVARNMKTGSFMEAAGTRRGRARLARRFRTFVVGSDQVWRAAYADIPAQFLDVLEPIEGDRPRRISFAASFGVDDIAEYSDDDRSRAAALIRRFDAVSVREESGVRICHDEFGVRAERHLDPTMLLSAEHYRELVSRTAVDATPAAGRLLIYRLDANDDVSRVERVLGERLGLPSLELLAPWPPSYLAYVSNPAEFVRPSIAYWLASVASAGFVVTDSFHGCAYSILFNRPFVVYANAERGATRFDSLLEVFGLEHHRVGADSPLIDERVFAPDWTRVNRVLDTERVRGLSYLRANL
ncbi:polysaccharide pyruvyl transferase family protein [Agromyces sp. SYSU K20354]|uniref:polysaccharide pyruvyl transferase family protein n=1 Tax=Agromyces cavernae TaxID=2898659 RepID=UPI001E42B7A9|nr:polysaccharide pyruvyl transferase family protein [Agromyces cavernae]MCD2441006.1 polysaccharide pyruvyl transferase family protein [Agromyces cavernae]